MKKSLIALAVAGTFAAPAAFGATANVDVYGQLKVFVENVDNGVNDKTRVTTGNAASLGFKGSEDLGGGLKAIWQVETNVSLDGDNNGAGGAAAGALNGTRNTYLGLAGGFGTVLVGVHDTPYKLSTGRLDNFVGTLGDYNSIMGAMDNSNNASALFDLRPSNVIAYVSPNFSGFQARVGYVMSGEKNFTTANINEGDAWSLDLSYAQGPLFVTGAYEKHNLYGGASASSGGTIVLNNNTGAKTEREAWKIGAGYKFGDLSLGAMYENIEVANADRGAWMLNAGYAMGPITLKAMYMNADDRDGTNNTGAKQWNLGVDYALSKRTTVQFVYANLDNDANAQYQLGQGSNTVTSGAAGQDQNGFAIGVRHSF